MVDELARYRWWYRRLVRLYPRPYRARFAESMEQTFADLLRERAQVGRAFMLWIFVETFAGVVRERATNLARFAVTMKSAGFLKLVKYSAIALAALMVAGIATLMLLARGTGEDIAGIVALALLVIIVSAVAAVVAAVLQRAGDRRRSRAGNDAVG